MTIAYDPKHTLYLDEADVRQELTRVYDTCYGCRLCLALCTSFPTLFEMIDLHDDHDAGRLTPAQQDQVIDECFQCKLCYLSCPYTPDRHELALDFPRLMLRATAMRREHNQISVRSRATTAIMGHTDLAGRLGSAIAPLANQVLAAPAGSLIRKVFEKTTGVSSVRLLPPYAKERFSTWFNKRARPSISTRQGTVAVFPTCLVEYQKPEIGHDLVKVYERNGIECSLAEGTRCCGAPYLHNGDLDQFNKIAAKNVAALATSVRNGKDIVVPQPTCGYVLRTDYVDYVGGPDATLVAEHTFDAAEYLMRVHEAAGTQLDTDFPGPAPATVTYHLPCHLKAQDVGLTSRDLIALTGAEVTVVQQCSGVDGFWGLRAENDDIAVPIAQRLGDEIRRADGDVVAGDCNLANTAIAEQTGHQPQHPLELVARAYGIPKEPSR